LRVLLVEDDEVVRMTAQAMLVSLGHVVTPARDGDEALSRLQAGHPVDLIFTDLMMPGHMDGLSLLRAARAMRPGVATLLSSGWTDEAHAGEAGRRGGDAFLLKPYTLADLTRAIERALG
jgi:CheY-like chemotaxis protein